jgi:AcrR family transcriptional regulator
MSVKSRILDAASDLLTRSAVADLSTRSVCDAAGVTAPTLYHHFGDKEGLLAAVVDFGWTQFLETKRAAAAVVHADVADDIRTGWNNHMAFARENPNFYKLMWSPAVAPASAAVREAHRMLFERLELGAAREQLKVSPQAATQMIMAAATGAALSLISEPELFVDDSFAGQLREAVIAAVVSDEAAPAPTRSSRADSKQRTVATAAATLSSKLRSEPVPLTDAERVLMQQWLKTLADTPMIRRTARSAE